MLLPAPQAIFSQLTFEGRTKFCVEFADRSELSHVPSKYFSEESFDGYVAEVAPDWRRISRSHPSSCTRPEANQERRSGRNQDRFKPGQY